MRKLLLLVAVLLLAVPALVSAQGYGTTGISFASPLALPVGSATAPSYSNSAQNNYGMYFETGKISFTLNGTKFASFVNASLSLDLVSDSALFRLGASSDVVLKRSAANALYLVNSTNAQTFSVANTDDGAGNYERGRVYWSSNVFTLDATQLGTGTARPVQVLGATSTGANIVGGSLTLAPGAGTGSAAGSSVAVKRALMTGAGSGAQALASAITVCESKTLSNTTAQAQTVAIIDLASNSSGAGRATISVQCNDGTNFDSDIVTTYVGYVNKAASLTIGTPVTTASAAANNSGSCTVAPTWIAGTNQILLKVTPVITTITPTTTTGFYSVETFGTSSVAVACQ
jgi:hypothetical protein